MSKLKIITAIVSLFTKIFPNSCKSKCCSGSECECGNKNILDKGELEEDEATIQTEETTN